MLTARNVVTFILVAALVPVAMIGVANWRPSFQPGVASAVPAPKARPQLGRSASPWSPTVGQMQSGDDQPYRPGIPGAARRPSGDDVVNHGAEARMAHAVMFPREPYASESTTGSAPRPFGIAAGFGSSAVNSALPGQAAAGGNLAVVEFIGVTQDMKLLQQDEFMAQLMRELKIVVWWNVAGPQSQRLELISPDGTLYKRFSVQFDGDAAGVGRIPVETRLPVGGTWITEYSLFGTWRADVYLGSQATPVTSASFILNR